MRAIWTGAITFGLVNVPVKLYSATDDHDITLHQVHAKDGGRIRYQRRCEVCDKVVSYEDIDRAYVEGDETVCLREDELDSIPQEQNHEISVVEFVPNDQIDPILFERSYYLQATGKSPRRTCCCSAPLSARTARRSCSSRCDRRRASPR